MNDSLEGARVVVTGGAGFIGSHVTERILDAGPAHVTVIDDLSTGSVANLEAVSGRFEMVEGDVCDAAVAAVAADADLVLHLAVRNVRASLGKPAENLRVNANGTLAVLEAMRNGSQGRFLYVSSSEIYGIPPDGTYAESTLPAPTTVYGAGKLAGEHIALAYSSAYGMDTFVVRPFNNYGPRSHFEGDSGEVVPKFILRALAGRPLMVHGDGAQSRDFMFVRDTAEWLVRFALTDGLAGQVFNIGTGSEWTVLDLAQRVLVATRSPSEIVHTDPRPGDLPRLCANVAKAREQLGFAVGTTFDDGLAETIRHFEAQDVEALLTREIEQTWTI